MALLSLVALLAAGGVYYFESRPSQTPDSERLQVPRASSGLLEKRPTLSPALYTGTVQSAYQIARDIPEVLDQLYCYCRCQENFNHLNLLTCYTDNHAAT